MAVQSIRLFGLEGLSNVGQVTENIFRGAQPGPTGYKTLADFGFQTVLNLSKEDELEAVHSAGMQPMYLPLGFFGEIERDKVEAALEMLMSPKYHPIFVHCAQGCDRTGLIIACYRIRTGWPNNWAAEEMSAFGYHYIWSHFMDFVKSFK